MKVMIRVSLLITLIVIIIIISNDDDNNKQNTNYAVSGIQYQLC